MTQGELVKLADEELVKAGQKIGLIIHSKSWVDQGTYAKEVMRAHHTAMVALVTVVKQALGMTTEGAPDANAQC